MKNIEIGTELTAKTGTCIGIIVYSGNWKGTVVKMLKNGFKIHFTEVVHKEGKKEVSRREVNETVNYKLWKTCTTDPVDGHKLPEEEHYQIYKPMVALGAKHYGYISTGKY